jgi:hypothetical protein
MPPDDDDVSRLLAGLAHGQVLTKDLVVELLQREARNDSAIHEMRQRVDQLARVVIANNGQAGLVTQVALHEHALGQLGSTVAQHAVSIDEGELPTPAGRPAVQIAIITLLSTVLTAVIALIRDWLIGARIPHP